MRQTGMYLQSDMEFEICFSFAHAHIYHHFRQPETYSSTNVCVTSRINEELSRWKL